MNPLAPLGAAYGAAARLRNYLYERGRLRSHALGAHTISIGNITTGGTGKTPLAALTARMLAASGERVCILTRGYGREASRKRVVVSDGKSLLADARTGGDEPVELALKLMGDAAVVADADRVAAARWAIEEFGTTAFVLDDGFQHRRVRRDADIVCIDATDPFGGGHLLPAGRLREPVDGLRRADAIVITRADLADDLDKTIAAVRQSDTRAPILSASTRISRISRLPDLFSAGHSPDDQPKTSAPFVFCGIGNPGGFRSQLENAGFAIAGFRAFGDHHKYRKRDIVMLEREAAARSATWLLTTVKDAMKLGGLEQKLPIFAAEAEMELSDLEAYRRVVLRRDA